MRPSAMSSDRWRPEPVLSSSEPETSTSEFRQSRGFAHVSTSQVIAIGETCCRVDFGNPDHGLQICSATLRSRVPREGALRYRLDWCCSQDGDLGLKLLNGNGPSSQSADWGLFSFGRTKGFGLHRKIWREAVILKGGASSAAVTCSCSKTLETICARRRVFLVRSSKPSNVAGISSAQCAPAVVGRFLAMSR